MAPSNQTLMDDIINVVFEKVDLECQDKSILIEFLPTLFNEDSKFDVKIKFRNI